MVNVKINTYLNYIISPQTTYIDIYLPKTCSSDGNLKRKHLVSWLISIFSFNFSGTFTSGSTRVFNSLVACRELLSFFLAFDSWKADIINPITTTTPTPTKMEETL